MMTHRTVFLGVRVVGGLIPALTALFLLGVCGPVLSAADWPQFKFDAGRTGYSPTELLDGPMGLAGFARLTDACLTAPAVAEGHVVVVDGSGVAFCFEQKSLREIWRFASPGGPMNCNNVSSPAIVPPYVHFGTMSGRYYVLELKSGRKVREIDFGEPIFSSPAVTDTGVYCATLGGRVFALESDGRLRWVWDYCKERLGFEGDRWRPEDWLRHKQGRVTWRDQFVCPWDLVARGKQVVVPVGGEVVVLRDQGDKAHLEAAMIIPPLKGTEKTGLFGLCMDDRWIYCQWHRRDNTSRVELLPVPGTSENPSFVLGTLTRNDLPGSVGFASVSFRGNEIFRTRPEQGFGLCRHRRAWQPDQAEEPGEVLSPHAAIAAPVVARDYVVFGTLDGRICGVPLEPGGEAWEFQTPFGQPITAPAAISKGRVYFAGEDGYLYMLAKGASHSPPAEELPLWELRGPRPDPAQRREQKEWFTNFGDFENRNSTAEPVSPPLRLKWIRRYEGTFKHLPVCGGGRMYTHTAEGMIFAVEQSTGRLLWRKFFPGVFVSYTSPLYWQERLIVPQAGLQGSFLRCLDAATGRLLWEAPFTGSPSWSRQQPPVVHNNILVYMFSTGHYAPEGTGIFVFRGQGRPAPSPELEVMSWLYSHDNPYYPVTHRPLVRAWDLETGRVLWTRDFSELGSGGDDGGLCLMDGVIYYSMFFGYNAQRRGESTARGVTAALEPETGRVLWLTTEYSVTGGATISADQGRLYLGGYNAWDSRDGSRHVWCLDARDGSLVWKSDPLVKAINVVTVGPDFVFAYAYGGNGYLIDKNTGKILQHFNFRHACTRFTLAGRYLLGPNGDLLDTADGCRIVSTGPSLDVRECVGGVASGGVIFFTGQASGMQMALEYGAHK